MSKSGPERAPARLPALDGVHVLECGHYIAGPRTAQILADHGAEVVKLEPLGGDPARVLPPKFEGRSLYFAAHNRGKQSVAVDLKRPEGRSVLERLIGWADVIVTNFTPSAVERLGLDLASAARFNPRLVVVRISAYGSTGQDRDQPGFDGQIQARSGLAHMVGPPDRPPTIASVPITDYLTAVEGALGALLGLQRRNATGEGQEVDVSMLDCASTLLGYLYADVDLFDHRPIRSGSRSPFALTGAFEAQDGFVYISPMGTKAWVTLFHLIGRHDWARPGSPYEDVDTRLREREVIERAISEWTQRYRRCEIQEVFDAVGIACSSVNDVNEAAADPLLAYRGMLVPVAVGEDGPRMPMPGVEVKVEGAAVDLTPRVPEVGAHTDQVLERLGYGRSDIEELRRAGIVR